MRNTFSRDFKKNTKFYENRSRGSRVPCRRTDGYRTVGRIFSVRAIPPRTRKKLKFAGLWRLTVDGKNHKRHSVTHAEVRKCIDDYVYINFFKLLTGHIRHTDLYIYIYIYLFYTCHYVGLMRSQDIAISINWVAAKNVEWDRPRSLASEPFPIPFVIDHRHIIRL